MNPDPARHRSSGRLIAAGRTLSAKTAVTCPPLSRPWPERFSLWAASQQMLFRNVSRQMAMQVVAGAGRQRLRCSAGRGTWTPVADLMERPTPMLTSGFVQLRVSNS